MPPDLIFDPDGDLTLVFPIPPSTPLRAFGSEFGPRIQENKVALGEDQVGDNAAEAPSALQSIGMLVSSKHLMLASPVFKAMLKLGAFKEGATLQNEGNVEIPLPDDNPEAFKILLNLVHCRMGEVPAVVTFKMMTALAILVDKYEMLEVVKLCVHHLWMPHLRKELFDDITSSTAAELLAISWVFQLPKEFSQASILGELYGTSSFGYPYDFLGPALPIPESVLESIQKHRQKSINQALTILGELINTYQSGVVCTASHVKNKEGFRLACDGVVLGSLLKSAAEKSLWPSPKAPYPSLSAKKVLTAIRSVDVISLCGNQFHQANQSHYDRSHGIKESIRILMNNIESSLTGLSLDSFFELQRGKKAPST